MLSKIFLMSVRLAAILGDVIYSSLDSWLNGHVSYSEYFISPMANLFIELLLAATQRYQCRIRVVIKLYLSGDIVQAQID